MCISSTYLTLHTKYHLAVCDVTEHGHCKMLHWSHQLLLFNHLVEANAASAVGGCSFRTHAQLSHIRRDSEHNASDAPSIDFAFHQPSWAWPSLETCVRVSFKHSRGLVFRSLCFHSGPSNIWSDMGLWHLFNYSQSVISECKWLAT